MANAEKLRNYLDPADNGSTGAPKVHRGCQICAHPERARIEALYRVGAALDKLAALFPPLKPGDIYKHCLRQPVRPARGARPHDCRHGNADVSWPRLSETKIRGARPPRPEPDFAELVINAERADARSRRHMSALSQIERARKKIDSAQRKRAASQTADPAAAKPPRQPRWRPSRQLVSEGPQSGNLLQAKELA